MNPSLLDLIATLAAGLAVTLSVFSLGALILRRQDAKKALASLQKADTSAAIADAELGTLGFHLFARLGETSMRAYASNSEVRDDFDLSFNSIRFYLGSEDEDQNTPAAESGARLADPPMTRSQEFSAVDGDMWAALARARRELEIELKSRLELPEEKFQWSARRLLAAAAHKELIDSGTSADLDNALIVANRAIHGVEVSDYDAERAVSTIDRFLAKRSKPPAAQERNVRSSRVQRDVISDGNGKWVVVKPGAAGISARAATQREAVDRARDIVYKAGGGEVTIHGTDGRIRSKDTVRGRGGSPSRSSDGGTASRH